MITFDELTKVNETIDTVGIEKKNKKTGKVDVKQYAEVPQRIKAFRMLVPNGGIETELLSLKDGVAVIKATVKDEEGRILGTGTAYEKEGSSFINQTSYIENCETSAVGRALAMCGIGIDLSIASYEEVANAKVNQGEELIVDGEKIEPVKSEQQAINEATETLMMTKSEMIKFINESCPEGTELKEKLDKYCKGKALEDMNDAAIMALYNNCKNKGK